jgi:hypothetical protein
MRLNAPLTEVDTSGSHYQPLEPIGHVIRKGSNVLDPLMDLVIVLSCYDNVTLI